MEKKADYDEYYAESLRKSQEYQDFICVQLHSRGIVLQNMTSQRSQLKGENLFGLEIKFDNKIGQYQRVYIETAEKSHLHNSSYIASGIYRDDNAWLFGIGDYEIFYIFGKRALKRLDQHNPPWLYRPPETGTSRGFCIPCVQAEEMAERVFRFKEE